MLTQGIRPETNRTSPPHPSELSTNLTMELFVNTEKRTFAGSNLAELMRELQMIATNGIALAVNEQVVPRSGWDQYELKNNDKIIIIKATQGG